MAVNPDVPDLVHCRALAEAGWNPGDECLAWYRVRPDADWVLGLPGETDYWDEAQAEVVSAPTIGAMLAYCRERGWYVSLECHEHGEVSVTYGNPDDLQYLDIYDTPANALAEAVAQAMKTGGKAVMG